MLWSRVCLVLLSTVSALAGPLQIQLVGEKGGLSELQFVVDGGTVEPQVRRRDSLLDVIKEEKQFSRFYEMIQRNKGLQDEIDNSDKMTIFAPTNEAVERWEKHRGKNSRDDWKPEEIVHYHMIPDEEMTSRNFYDGQLLHTRLKSGRLEKQQRVRVTRIDGHVYLNMLTHVCFDNEHRTERGVVVAVDDVLVPPRDLSDIMCTLPTKFSTFVAAVNIVGIENELLDAKTMTLLAPDNDAWNALGFMNLFHLFSVNGRDDLKKILYYHMGKEVIYSTKMMKEDEVKIKTHNNDEEICISACRKEGQGDGHSCRRDEGRRRMENELSEGDRPADYMFLVNKGEARIKFTDGLAENGVIQVVNEVLIPPGVKLPYASCEGNAGASSGMTLLG